MTNKELIQALRCGEDANGTPRPEPSAGEIVCYDPLKLAAADLIERLEKERNALIEAANSRKLCEICKNDSYCFDARCTENTCDDCYQYRVCPCSNCLSHPKFEWKGLEKAL